MRRRAKVDDNQKEVVQALRAAGCSVQSLATTGAGVPDLLVGYGGQNYLLEVKNPQGRNRLTPAQKEWHAKWRGQCAVVRSVQEAFSAIGHLDWILAHCTQADNAVHNQVAGDSFLIKSMQK